MMSAEISVYLDVIEKVAGTRWLHDQVHRIRGADPRHEIGAVPGSAGINPLALSWYNAREELIMSEITGTGSFSKNTLRLADLGKNLSSVSGMAGFMEQKNRLLDQSLFRNAAYEIAIAAGYAGMGSRVEFTAPGLRLNIPDSRVVADCFVSDINAGDMSRAIYDIIGWEINKGEEHTGPAIAYLELNSGWYAPLRNQFEQYSEKIKTLLAGKVYDLLIISCQGTVTEPAGIKLCEAGFTIANPAPRFGLPAGFKIYTPGESSSIS